MNRLVFCLLTLFFAGFLAAEGTMAVSPYRMTTAGETFSHYG